MGRCATCKPTRHRIDYPGGFIWRHQDTCLLFRNQRVGQERTRSENEARTLHPAGNATDINVQFSFSKGFAGWHRQPKVGPMTEAVAFVDAHVDDELEDADR